LHVYEWTLTSVKHRESLHKQDKRDIAQSVFAQDRDGRLTPRMVFIRNQVLDNDQDDEAGEEGAQNNLAVFRMAFINDMIVDAEIDVVETDRALLLSTAVEMTRTEFDLLSTLIRVYDHARSHFVFEVCEPSTKHKTLPQCVAYSA
jgi:hypothetical protein